MEAKLKKALEVPASNRERREVKLASKKANTPYSPGPNPRAMSRPDTIEMRAFVILATRAIAERLTKVN